MLEEEEEKQKEEKKEKEKEFPWTEIPKKDFPFFPYHKKYFYELNTQNKHKIAKKERKS